MKLRLEALPIYVAHYTKLTDRRSRLEQELRRFGLRSTWLTDYDPEELTAEVTERSYRRDDELWRLKTDFYTREPARALRRSELSLALKHLDFYQRVKDGPADCALVLEDDAMLTGDFRDRFDGLFAGAPDDFDFIFIGSGCGLRVPNARPSVHFYPKLTPAAKCTDSYLIRRQAAERLLSAVPPITLPIDFELNYQLHALNMRVYWLEPPIVVQGSQNGTYRSAIQ